MWKISQTCVYYLKILQEYFEKAFQVTLIYTSLFPFKDHWTGSSKDAAGTRMILGRKVTTSLVLSSSEKQGAISNIYRDLGGNVNK